MCAGVEAGEGIIEAGKAPGWGGALRTTHEEIDPQRVLYVGKGTRVGRVRRVIGERVPALCKPTRGLGVKSRGRPLLQEAFLVRSAQWHQSCVAGHTWYKGLEHTAALLGLPLSCPSQLPQS